MALRAVVLDLFDTLVDLRFEDVPRMEHEGRQLPASLGALHEAVASHAAIGFAEFLRTLRVVDEEMREVQVEQGREISTQQRFQVLARTLEVEAEGLPERLTQLHMRTLKGAVSVPRHHEKLLAELGRDKRIGLCSNFTHSETALAVLDEAGFRSHFDAVAISDAVGWRKPRREIFDAVLQELDVAPEEVLHVGDSLRADVAGAAALGIRTAWITRRVRDPEAQLSEHEGPAPDFTIRDLAELPALLD